MKFLPMSPGTEPGTSALMLNVLTTELREHAVDKSRYGS